MSCFRDRHVNQVTDQLCLSRVWRRLSVAAYPVCLVVLNQDRERVLIGILIVTVLSAMVQNAMVQNVTVQNAMAQNARVPTVAARTLMAQIARARIEVTPIVTVPTLVIRSVMEARSCPDAKV